MSPIPLDELRARSGRGVFPRLDSLPDRVLTLLRENTSMAWRPFELAERLDVAQTTLSPALTRLRRRGLVEKEQGHWYALEDVEVAKRQAMILGNRAANEKWGREDPEDWPAAPRE